MDESDSAALSQLASRAVEGDHSALDQLLRELRPQIVRTVRLVVGAGSWAAEDAAQEALIDIMRGIRTLREPRAIRAWAIRVAASRALKVARQERVRAIFRLPADEADLTAAAPEQHAAELKRAFDALPPKMRAVAVLRLYSGLSEQETAAALRCSLGTVKSQLHEARRRLADALRTADRELRSAPPPDLPPRLEGK